MEILESKTVAEYVTENIKTAHVFKKHGIDFCCGGNVSVETACKKNNVDQLILEKELSVVDEVNNLLEDYDKWSLDYLIDYIVDTHHVYVKESMPIIIQYLNKVESVHGNHYTELIEINKLFTEVANELQGHLQKEEQVLFPYIKKIVATKNDGGSIAAPPFGTVSNPIRMMEHEHESAGDIFKQIANLTKNYTPPVEACNTFKALYAILNEFEQDLHQHIHLENNILHPKAIVLEKELTV